MAQGPALSGINYNDRIVILSKKQGIAFPPKTSSMLIAD